MNSVFSVKKVIKDALNACLDNFGTLFFRALQMYFYLVLLIAPFALFFARPLFEMVVQGDFFGFTFPISWAIGSIVIFFCYINFDFQYQKVAWRALHNQKISSFRFQDFSFGAFGLSVLLSCLVVPGYFLLVPGIYFSVRFGYASLVFAVENLSIMDSLRKSWQLTRGHVIKLLGVFFIVNVLRLFSLLAYPLIVVINASTYKQLVDIAHRH